VLAEAAAAEGELTSAAEAAPDRRLIGSAEAEPFQSRRRAADNLISSQAKTGLVGPVQERPLDAVTSQHGATGGKERLVWLWPVSVARTALASRQPNSRQRGTTSRLEQSWVHLNFNEYENNSG